MTELSALIESMCQGTATHADRDRLENLLRDPANRAEYLAATRLHSELLWRWHRGRIDVIRPTRGRQASGHATGAASAPNALFGVRQRFAAAVATARDATMSWLRYLTRPAPFACLVAASVLGTFLVTAGVLSIGQSGDPAFAAAGRQVRPIVARVSGLHAVRWASPRDAWHDLDALPKGSRIEVAAGLVQVTHLDGANVVIEGPASYQVQSPTTGRLIRGRLAARTEHDEPTVADDRPASAVPDGTPLFTVITPQRLVHDLGTEFGVEVQESGDTGVHVFEGLVELAAVDRAIAENEVPVRLGAGESAGIDEAGKVSSGGRSLARAFVRSLPKVEGKPELSFLEKIGWNDAKVETLVRDVFDGSGPIVGRTPTASIDGATWIGLQPGWNLRDGSLAAESAGSALVPFRPEPGWLYRLTVPFKVAAGGKGWCAIGFKAGNRPTSNHGDDGIAWMLRGHPADHQHIQEVFAGSGILEKVAHWNRCGPAQTFSIILDTTAAHWRAHFLVDNEPVAFHRYASPQTAINCAGISILSAAHVRIDSFTLERTVKLQPGERATQEINRATQKDDKS